MPIPCEEADTKSPWAGRTHMALTDSRRETKDQRSRIQLMSKVRNSNFVDYAPNLDSYSQSTIADYLKRFDISSEGEVEHWIKNNRDRINRQTRGHIASAESRDIQRVCAVAIRRHFRKHPSNLGFPSRSRGVR